MSRYPNLPLLPSPNLGKLKPSKRKQPEYTLKRSLAVSPEAPPEVPGVELSAEGGGCCTSQQVAPLQRSRGTCRRREVGRSASMEEETKRGQRQRACSSYFVGAATGCLSTLVTFPIYKTIFRQQLHASCITEAVRQLYHEGFYRIYRGVFPPLVVRTLQGTLMFGTYRSFCDLLSTQPLGSSSRRAMAGLFAGCLEALVFCPFERVQNVLQDGRKVQRFPTTRHILTTFHSYPLGERFSLGFYRGLGLILIRNSLGTSLYFALEEPLQHSFSTESLPDGIQAFVSGSICGSLVSLLLYPLGILVANVQSQVGRQEILSLSATMAQVWQARGRKALLLYRGGSLLILRSSLTWGLQTAINQFLSKVTS